MGNRTDEEAGKMTFDWRIFQVVQGNSGSGLLFVQKGPSIFI